jgi:hypothetical protein
MRIEIAGFPANLYLEQVTIPAGTAVSEMVATQGMALVGIIMPGTWTAAAIGFKACASGNPSNLLYVYDSGGNPITTVVSTSRHVAFPMTDALFAPYLQIASVTAGSVTAVNQVAAAVLLLLFRRYLN